MGEKDETGTEMPAFGHAPKHGGDRKSESGGRGGSTELADHLKAPPDTNNFAYNIMFWQGVGQLFLGMLSSRRQRTLVLVSARRHGE